MSPDQALAPHCRRQFGVFTSSQAHACGLPDSTITRRVQRGRYIRLYPGVFMDPAVPRSWEARAMAGLLAVGGEAVLARTTAARVHGLGQALPSADGIHLLDGVRTFASLPGLVVHRSKTFDATDVTQVGPFRTTTVTRTIVDLAADLPPALLRAIVAEAVRCGATSATELRMTARRLGKVAGRRAILDLADELSPLDADCRSPLETTFLRIMTRAGLPPTAMNHPVVDVTGRRRFIDAVYLPEHLPIELDSKRWHGSALDRNDDVRRENRIVLAGWRDFLRFTRHDLDHRPAEVVATVRLGLDAARLAIA